MLVFPSIGYTVYKYLRICKEQYKVFILDIPFNFYSLLKHLEKKKKMSAFLLLFLVFSSQLIGGLNTPLPSPIYGNLVTILSIDGGGIRGIIPAVVLDHFEKALQVNDQYIHFLFYFI